jgi:tRNA-modifying protein YgfZ
MADMPTIHRPSRAVFRFSGDEAQKLLNDTLTGRILAEPGPAAWWALLSPQGKIQAEGLSRFVDGAFWLDVDKSVADAFFKRMKMYRLRAHVEIEDLRETHRVGWSEWAVPGALEDVRAGGLGWTLVAEVAVSESWVDTSELWASRRIDQGLAELGPDFPADATFPHDIGMDLLNGIDFIKGCYIGQEVVSRMKHRGTARRRPVIVSGLGKVAAGASVIASGRDAGAIGVPIDGRAIAILRLDRITDLDAVSVGGEPVQLTLPNWATYTFGEAGEE